MEWVSQPEEKSCSVVWWYSSSRVKYEDADAQDTDALKCVNECFFYYQLSCRWFSWLIAWFINCQKKVKKWMFIAIFQDPKLTQWLDQQSKISPRYSVSHHIKQKTALFTSVDLLHFCIDSPRLPKTGFHITNYQAPSLYDCVVYLLLLANLLISNRKMGLYVFW